MKFLSSIMGVALASVTLGVAKIESYDPLEVTDLEIVSKTFEVRDIKRDRNLPIRVYLPEANESAPVILFSHGLGGSCDNNPYLGNPRPTCATTKPSSP